MEPSYKVTTLCATNQAVTECSAGGVLPLECFYAFHPDNSMTKHIFAGHMFTFVALVAIGMFVLLRMIYNPLKARKKTKTDDDSASADRQTDNTDREQPSTDDGVQRDGSHATPWQAMQATVAGYSIITGFFALFRGVWHLGRLLVIGAAIHNLFEWFMVSMLFLQSRQKKKVGFLWATMAVTVVVLLIIMFRSLQKAVVVEQAAGILLDFMMPVNYASLWLTALRREPSKAKLFLPPFLLSTVHLLFTILPLVLANFFVDGSHPTFTWINEMLIYSSAVFTMLGYAYWCRHYDAEINCQSLTPGLWVPFKDSLRSVSTYRVFSVLAVSSFIVGYVSLAVVPATLGVCPVPFKPYAKGFQNCPVTGMMHFVPKEGQEDALMTELQKLVPYMRSEPGSVSYTFYRNPLNNNETILVEEWASLTAIQTHLQSDNVKYRFHSPVIQDKVATSKTMGPWVREGCYERVTRTATEAG